MQTDFFPPTHRYTLTHTPPFQSHTDTHTDSDSPRCRGVSAQLQLQLFAWMRFGSVSRCALPTKCRAIFINDVRRGFSGFSSFSFQSSSQLTARLPGSQLSPPLSLLSAIFTHCTGCAFKYNCILVPLYLGFDFNQGPQGSQGLGNSQWWLFRI